MSDDTDLDSTTDRREDGDGIRDRLDQLVDRARDGFDDGVVGVLSWLLNAETRTRVYVHLRQNPESTDEEVAAGIGLHPASVRETLDELVEEDAVERREAGEEDAEYVYAAVPPSDLVGVAVDPVRESLGTVVSDEEGAESVRIEVDSGSSVEAEAGEAEADVETDLEGEVGLDEEGATVAGGASGELDVETADGEADVEGSVDADVGTDGVDVDVEADVETPEGGEESTDRDTDGEESTDRDADGDDARAS